jgi:hypothetical protein
MKIKSLLIGSVLILTPFLCYSDQVDQNSLGLLMYRNLNDVRSFYGYFVNITFVKPEPLINISFMSEVGRTNKAAGMVSNKLIAQIGSAADQDDLTNIQTQLQNFKDNKTGTKMVEVDSLADDGLVKYNLIDINKKVLSSFWFDPTYGFVVKTAVYGLSGRLLSYSFFSSLKINPGQIAVTPGDGKSKNFGFDDFMKETRRPFDTFGNIQSSCDEFIQNHF